MWKIFEDIDKCFNRISFIKENTWDIDFYPYSIK